MSVVAVAKHISESPAVLTQVYLVDIEGNTASYGVTCNKQNNRYSLKNTSRSANFGKAGHTEYASLYFEDSAESLDITGDLWRFIEGKLGIDTFIDVTNRHGTSLVESFKYVFAMTSDDEEALQKWHVHVETADKELLNEDLAVI